MKRSDIIFLLCVILFILPFILVPSVYQAYEQFNAEHGIIMSFIKFAILATLGEVIGLRIKTGNYNAPGFGIMPRAMVWGLLGITIKLAFVVFTTGTINFLEYIGVDNPAIVYGGPLSLPKVLIAFSISVLMNTIYAPVMMTTHKITDTHIINNGGTLSALLKPIDFASILKNINWDVQWNFVFKKTIPFFWYPAHTITFLLAAEYQVLFAAMLSIALGLILALASMKSSSSRVLVKEEIIR